MTKTKPHRNWHVLVTGGAGYVGSALVPKLLAAEHKVTVLDLYLYGDPVFSDLKDNPNLREIKGDLRDMAMVEQAMEGVDAVIHLACISNDPSFDLNPELGRSINYDAFRPLVQASKRAGVRRFIYASSSAVYGIKEEAQVTEALSLDPLTDYAKYKALCEEVLEEERSEAFTCLTLRPATVCGYAKRLRLDLTVNILTNHAVTNNKIKVFGGQQQRPNIHVEDMTDLYLECLQYPAELINGQTFNAGYENHRIIDIANMVQTVVAKEFGRDIEIEITGTNDPRSYRINSDKLQENLGFKPKHTIEDAITSLVLAFRENWVENSMTDSKYFNIKRMQEVRLS